MSSRVVFSTQQVALSNTTSFVKNGQRENRNQAPLKQIIYLNFFGGDDNTEVLVKIIIKYVIFIYIPVQLINVIHVYCLGGKKLSDTAVPTVHLDFLPSKSKPILIRLS